MKKTAFIILIFSFFASCAKEQVQEGASGERISLEAVMPETRAYLHGTSFVWYANDQIRVYNGKASAVFTNRSAAGASVATFDGVIPISAPEDGLWAVYPYDAATIFSNGEFSFYVSSTQQTNTNLSSHYPFIAHTGAESRRLEFQNVLGGVAFTLKRGDISRVVISAPGGESIAGSIKATLGANGTPTITSVKNGVSEIVVENSSARLTPGTRYYVPMIPTTLSKGLVFKMYTDELSDAVQTVTSAKAIKRSTFGILKQIDGKATFSEVPSNCYLVAPNAEVSFEARYGVSPEKLQGSYSMFVLWESTGTEVAPSKGSVVRSVSASNGRITVKAGDQLGNAVIAASSPSGGILWSWHIWVTRDTPHAVSVDRMKVMDRNLGALSREMGNPLANGLYYQYNRKDPFPGAASLSSAIRAKATPATPAPVDPGSDNYSIAYATAHPAVFIVCSTQDREVNALHPNGTDIWSSSRYIKGRQDPCPAGWGLEREAFSEYIQQYTVWKAADYGRYDQTNSLWFPAAGRLDGSGALTDVGLSGQYWLLSEKYSLLAGSSIETQDELYLPGLSVRCVAR